MERRCKRERNRGRCQKRQSETERKEGGREIGGNGQTHIEPEELKQRHRETGTGVGGGGQSAESSLPWWSSPNANTTGTHAAAGGGGCHSEACVWEGGGAPPGPGGTPPGATWPGPGGGGGGGGCHSEACVWEGRGPGLHSPPSPAPASSPPGGMGRAKTAPRSPEPGQERHGGGSWGLLGCPPSDKGYFGSRAARTHPLFPCSRASGC